VDIARRIRELEGKIVGISRHSSRIRRCLDKMKRLEEARCGLVRGKAGLGVVRPG